MSSVDLDMDLLRCFGAVAGARSFTAAGDAVGLTQSGVSVRIRRLEAQLGARLFERSSRAVTLTPAGEVLLGYAERLLDLNDEAVRRLREPWAAGLLRLGVADYFAPSHLPVCLSRFRRHYPRVRLEVRIGLGMDLIPGFQRGELDVVVASREEDLPGGEMLLEDPLVWAASPAFVHDAGAPVPLVTLPQGCRHRRAAIEGLEGQGRRWEIVFVSSGMAGVQAAVRAGLGLAVLPSTALVEGLRPVGLEPGLPALPPAHVAAFLSDDRPEGLQRSFVDFLRQELTGGGAPGARPAP